MERAVADEVLVDEFPASVTTESKASCVREMRMIIPDLRQELLDGLRGL